MSFTPRQSLITLERWNWNTDWVPPHTRVLETPAFCALVSPVESARFNSVLRCLDTGAALEARMNQINTLYAHRCARFHLYPHRHDDEVRRHLETIGFAPEMEYDARVIESAAVAKPTPVDGVRFVTVNSLETLRDAETVITHVFDGERPPPSAEALQHHLNEIRAHKVHQMVGYDVRTNRPVAQAGIAFYEALGMGFLFGGSTVETHRGRGIYRALIESRAAVCRGRAFPLVGLWAHQETSSPITARHGFTRCGTMTRWTRDADHEQTPARRD